MKADTPEYWLQIAQEDINTARYLLDGGRYLYAGFLMHLIAEKALKALLAKPENMPPRTHNLLRLAELAGINDTLDESQWDLLNRLLPLQIEVRYPSDQQEIAKTLSKNNSEELFARTEAFYEWIKQRL
ncbi:hypothetical protein FACS1894184_00950 [Clostridia bacterium]|nr:hypothetical protein FACS1894184_00950 [Clostridia bacterium]